MNINAKFHMKLSAESVREYQKFLKRYSDKLPEVAENIVNRVSEIGLEGNYQSTEKIPVKNNGNIVSGGIRTTNEADTYKEFGTGIVGSNNPHISDILAKIGWKYDVNKHGEKGWIYPKADGSFGWTKGISAQKKLYNAIKNMEREFQNIAIEEFKKASK